jgi:hypothetical protein
VVADIFYPIWCSAVDPITKAAAQRGGDRGPVARIGLRIG